MMYYYSSEWIKECPTNKISFNTNNNELNNIDNVSNLNLNNTEDYVKGKNISGITSEFTVNKDSHYNTIDGNNPNTFNSKFFFIFK